MSAPPPGGAAADRRTARRLAAGSHVTVRRAAVGRRPGRYLELVASNLSLGGMFLACPSPWRPGTVIDLEFTLTGPDGAPAAVRARAVVRWRRKYFGPCGMGVEFVEFAGLGQDEVRTWLFRLFGRSAAGG